MATARSLGIFGLLFLLVITPVVRAADDPDVETLTSKGLVKNSSGQYVLASENEVVDGMRTLRQVKAKMDAELKTRRELDRQIAERQDFLADGQRQLNLYEEKIASATDVTIHNQWVAKYNSLAIKMKEAAQEAHELQEKASKVGVTVKADYVDQMMSLSSKADAAKARYAEIEADPDVKSAIDHINAAGKAHIKLTPSGPFTAAANQLHVWRGNIEQESIPLFSQQGVNEVDTLVNGTPVRMIVDSGASMICLPAETATQLGLTPGPKDPVIMMEVADGRVVSGHKMTLKSVRVGRFTMENVECSVLDPLPTHPPALLGNTFLSHFVVKLDQEKSELHLTELSKDDKKVKMIGGDASKSPKK